MDAFQSLEKCLWPVTTFVGVLTLMMPDAVPQLTVSRILETMLESRIVSS